MTPDRENPVLPRVPPSHLARIAELLTGGDRRILGLVGPPGAGKSTLAEALCGAFAPLAQMVPMDGFHLAQVELERLGRSARKGAPDTFDAAGYAALLRRLRAQRQGDAPIYAPAFRREIEEPIAAAIAVPPATRLIITEGNYLLLDDGPWAEVTGLLDQVWYVDIEDRLRTDRLIARHEKFGRSPEQARAWVSGTDAANALLIEASRPRASHFFRWADD